MTAESLIYLDNNATTRPDPAVVEAMLPYWNDLYLNPASIAGELAGTSSPIRAAKDALAQLLGGESREFFLTSGATESNNWALQSIALQRVQQSGSCRILAAAIEHPSVLETLQILHRNDPRIQFETIPVLPNGQVNLIALEQFVTPETDLVSIMLANNESGVIQPIESATATIRAIAPACIIHTDATQAVGKIPVDLDGQLQHVDLLSLSAHKFHGPKGIGALFIREGTRIQPWLHGGNQQEGMRAGTENPALAAGLAKAVELAACSMSDLTTRVRLLRDSLEAEILSCRQGTIVLGTDAPRLPNTSLILFSDLEGEHVVHTFLEHGIATSTGAACSNGNDQPSHVIRSMGTPHQLSRNALRLSLSRYTSEQQIISVIQILPRVKWGFLDSRSAPIVPGECPASP